MPRGAILYGLATVVVIGGAVWLGVSTSPDASAGPCVVAGEWASLPEIPESSGLALGRRNRDIVWSHNDSGNAEVLYALDTAGRLRGRVRLPVRTRDWEDLSAAACSGGDCLFIADIGDNVMQRAQVFVYRVPEPAAAETTTARPVRFTVVYPDGPHNAEALFVVGDSLYIITKDRTGVLYGGGMEANGGTVPLRRIGEVGLSTVTDAEASPDGQWVVVRSPRDATIHRTADLIAGRADAVLRIPLEGLGEPQGEGVAFDGTRLFLSSEGRAWTNGGSFVSLRCAMPLEVSSRPDAG